MFATAALVFAATYAHREFGSAVVDSQRGAARQPERIAEWNELLQSGVLIGDSAAAVKVVEVADFECPFCRLFASGMRGQSEAVREKTALVFVHLPIPSHRFALPAARAAECAREQGRFAQIHDLIFEKQDSLGLKSWSSFARDAGVEDTVAFRRCADRTDLVAQVKRGQDMAAKLGINATPGVVVNGWRFFVPPKDSILTEILLAAGMGDDSLSRFIKGRRW